MNHRSDSIIEFGPARVARRGDSPSPASFLPTHRVTTVELRGKCRPIPKRDLDAIFAPRQFPPLDRLEGPPRNVRIEDEPHKSEWRFIAIGAVSALLWLAIYGIVQVWS